MIRQYHIRRDGAWVSVSEDEFKHTQPYNSRGLGDLVHAVAHPIAKAIDAVAGTNIQNCGGCSKRREALNRLTQ